MHYTVAGIAVIGTGIFVSGRLVPRALPPVTPLGESASDSSLTSTQASAMSAGPNRGAPSRVPASASASDSDPNVNSNGLPDLSEIRRELDEVRNCYQGGCNFAESDPRSYDFAVGQRLTELLDHLKAEVSEMQTVDAGLSALAREYLQIPDGHVQAAAIALLATQPSSSENLDPLLAEIIEGPFPDLVPASLVEIRRLLTPASESRIDEALGRAIRSGSPFVASEVIAGIAPFLTTAGRPYFMTVLEALPSDARDRRDLNAALQRGENSKSE